MKHIKIFVWLLVLIGLVTALLFHQKKKNDFQENQVKTNQMPISANETVATPKKPASNVPPAPNFITDTNDAHILALSISDFYAQTRIDRNLEWKMPINFWGRVVDENNDSIANANVHFSWNSLATELSPNGTTRAETTSDKNGFFLLTNQRGKRLYIDVGKEGYYSSGDAKNATFEYAQPEMRFVPDPNNPVVFHLRKKGQGASLIYRETLYGLNPDGTRQYLDFKTGNKTTGGAAIGDLMIKLTRTATDDPQRFNWSFDLQGLGGGGLIESQDEFMFEAPENGYVNAIHLEGRPDDYPYRNEIYRNYYVRLADGKTYARIKTDLYIKYNKEAAVDIVLYLNPSGSRNLEPK